MLMKPNVQVLAEQLTACLERIPALTSARVLPPGLPRESGKLDKREQQQEVDSVSDRYIELLNANAVDYIFINPGSDIAPIQESIAKFQAQGRRAPKLILCLHESVAMAAAHGYFMITGRPQVVLVHVDVGTQNIGANLHNAQRGHAGVVVCAGRSPYTIDGSLPGGRTRNIDWIQEQFNQASIVASYVKWHYEVSRRENLHVALQRAFQLAGTEPAGPVYLSLSREVLLEKMEPPALEPRRAPLVSKLGADPERLALAAQWLIEAERPLILAAYSGRNPKAVASLVGLAEKLAAPVVELRHRLNFPSGHPLHLGFSAAQYLQQADCVLIVDHDVPWVPAQGQPTRGCRVIHVDIDPLKRDIPIWGLPVDLPIQADSSQALMSLADEVERRLSPANRTRIDERCLVVTAEHTVQRSAWRQRALDLAERQPIAPEWAAYCLSEIVDDDTVVVSEAVSNNPVLWRYLNLNKPGTYFESRGSGLGWALGAALGAKLADPSKTILCTVGDGSWMFGSPIAAYWAAEQSKSPFLTVIFNNQAYAATTEAILNIAPEGYARKTGNYPACNLPKPPLCSKVAEALGLWAMTVEDPSGLPSALREALDEVRRGRSALVDICVSLPRPLTRMTEESTQHFDGGGMGGNNER
jgi:acetolactate synthase-1/2/3 large subunit